MSAQMSWEMPGSAHGVCHSGRVSRFAIAHVGLGVEMCAGKVENTTWEGDRLRRCQKKCRGWKYGVGGGLSAQMSGEMRRSAQTGCHTKRISMDACTHVGRRRRGEYERGGNRFFAGAQNDKRALGMTERVHVRREVATQGVSQGLPAQMSV